ncbi:MAG: hypothetical protein EXR45_02990 [Chloroflexi bacterium]|nr:hypothetical protein [Chloroflexota bacterium]
MTDRVDNEQVDQRHERTNADTLNSVQPVLAHVPQNAVEIGKLSGYPDLTEKSDPTEAVFNPRDEVSIDPAETRDTGMPSGSNFEVAVPEIAMPGLMIGEAYGEASDASIPVGVFAYWRRVITLLGVVLFLGALTVWEQQSIPDRPAKPVITIATPAPGATPPDSRLVSTLLRTQSVLDKRNARDFTAMWDPNGLVVAAYSGGIPETGYTVPDVPGFVTNVLTDARLLMLGWRLDNRGRVILLTDGWHTRPLRLSANSTLELTPLVALVFQVRDGDWALRWFLIDATGLLTQQARSIAWQPIPTP